MRSIVSVILLVLSAATWSVQGVPPDFVGDWVPKALTCQSQLRLRVEPDRAVLINGPLSKAFGNLDFCYSCEGGAKYSGMVVWMLPEFGGKVDPPFTARFNADERPGVAQLEFRDPETRRQFPLHLVPLKRCVKRASAP